MPEAISAVLVGLVTVALMLGLYDVAVSIFRSSSEDS